MSPPSQDALELFGDTERGLWVLRDVRAEDLDAVIEVELTAQPAPWTRVIFERELDTEHSHIWVAPGTSPDDPAIAGFCVLWLVHDEAHVLNVAVHQDCRRRGLATALLAELLERAPGSKPGLPRLRNELFSPGDLIDLYLGDTPGRRGSPWVTARVERVEKAFNADWAHDSSARGYYWRSTVRAVDGRDLLPGRPALGLSTTEPRRVIGAPGIEVTLSLIHI